MSIDSPADGGPAFAPMKAVTSSGVLVQADQTDRRLGLCPKTTRVEPVAHKTEWDFCVPLALPVLVEQLLGKAPLGRRIPL